ncbi:MAG TPA: hypothetical protein VG106_00690, partial [Vicinamibacterales bacterium]|nr:hypothetical protein [Vicinamibacterales bacterium]
IADGEHTIVCELEHGPEGETVKVASAPVIVLVDKTKPAIAFSESGTPLDVTKETPFGRDVKVDISVTDNLPGVEYTAKLDGADYVSGTAITADGHHVVAVRATDRAENTADAEVRILVDKTGPAIAFFESNNALDAAKRQDFNRLPSIEIRTSDALSNVTFIATLDGAPYTSGAQIAEGSHTIAVRATDALGNVTEAKLELLVDTTAPVVVLKEGDNDLPAAGAIFARDILARAAITDISKTTTVATLDGNPFSLTLPISAEGEHTLQVTVTDELKWSTTVSATFIIDKTAPKISVFEGTTPLLRGASFARDVVINASAEDITPVQLTAKIDGASYTLGQPYSANGSHTIVVDGVDAAGNRSEPVSILFHIDKNAPEVTLLESGQPFPLKKTFTRDVTATVKIVAATETTSVATIDDAPYTLGTPFAPEGRHHLKVVVTNLAGLSTTVEAGFTIDKTPPTLKLFAKPDVEFVADMKFAADLTPSTQADDNLTRPPKVVVLLDNRELPPG